MDSLSRPTSQLGRNAALIHGVMWLAAAVFAGAAYSVRQNLDEAMPVLSVGAAAVIVLGCWSVILSIRALIRAECSRWPVIVLLSILVESSATFVMFWGMSSYEYRPWLLNFALELALPVFVPIFTFTTFIALPLSIWLVNRRMGVPPISSNAGIPSESHPQYSRRQRWIRGLIYYFALSALLIVLLLPWPLYLYCAGSTHFWSDDEPTWRTNLFFAMPDFIRDTSIELLPLIGTNACNELHLRILAYGRFSKKRLQHYLNDPRPAVVESALHGLLYSDRETAVEYAMAIAEKRVSSNQWAQNSAGSILGDYGTPEQVRKVLRLTKAPVNLRFLFIGLGNNKRTGFIPDVERFIAENPADCEYALRALGQLLPPEQAEKLWLEYLTGSDAMLRRQAGRRMSVFSTAVAYRIALACLEHPDVTVRRSLINFAYISRADAKIMSRWGERLYKLLNDPDLAIRRAAAYQLADFTKTAGAKITRIPIDLPTDDSVDPSSETEAERHSMDTIRQQTRAWLDAQVKSK